MVLGMYIKGSKLLNFTFLSYRLVFQKKKDRIYHQDGNLHDFQGQFKEEILCFKGNIKTLESQVQNGGRMDTLVTTLGTHAGKEIHDLRKTIIEEFEMIKEIIFKFKLL